MELKIYLYFIVLKIITISILFWIFRFNIPKEIVYTTESVNTIKISIILLVKNNFEWLKYLDHKFSIIEKHYHNLFSFEFFIFENNSKDLSNKFLNKVFMRNRKGNIFSKNFSEEELKKYKFDDNISIERGSFMAMLRNKLKNMHGKLNSEYTVMIDSDIYFDFNIFFKMIEKLRNENIAMVTPFVTDFTDTIDGGYTHYYDTLALVTKRKIDFRKVGTLCLFKQCNKCRKLREIRNIKLNDNELLDINGENGSNLIEVESAFGGFCMIKTKVYNKCEWGDDICEHFYFCKQVRKYGNIVIATDIKITNNSS